MSALNKDLEEVESDETEEEEEEEEDTLQYSIRDACVDEVVTILEKYFVKHVHITEGECVCFANIPVTNTALVQ